MAFCVILYHVQGFKIKKVGHELQSLLYTIRWKLMYFWKWSLSDLTGHFILTIKKLWNMKFVFGRIVRLSIRERSGSISIIVGDVVESVLNFFYFIYCVLSCNVHSQYCLWHELSRSDWHITSPSSDTNRYCCVLLHLSTVGLIVLLYCCYTERIRIIIDQSECCLQI